MADPSIQNSPQTVADQSFLTDLQPFLDVTVVSTPNATITIGNLTYVSPQSISSTCYFSPPANNTLGPNLEGLLFQSAINDAGQGLAAGSTMTRGQTNFTATGGKLAANEVFVGVRVGFEIFKLRQLTAGTTAPAGAVVEGAAPLLIPDAVALQQIAQNLSWTEQIGDGNIRNNGPLADYPQGFGAWTPSPALSASATSAPNAIAAQNGSPESEMHELALPLLFYPTIQTLIKIVSGNAMVLTGSAVAPNVVLQAIPVQTGSTAAYNEVLAVRMTIDGYKCTSPV